MKLSVTVRPIIHRRHRRKDGCADDDMAKDSTDVVSSSANDAMFAHPTPILPIKDAKARTQILSNLRHNFRDRFPDSTGYDVRLGGDAS